MVYGRVNARYNIYLTICRAQKIWPRLATVAQAERYACGGILVQTHPVAAQVAGWPAA